MQRDGSRILGWATYDKAFGLESVDESHRPGVAEPDDVAQPFDRGTVVDRERDERRPDGVGVDDLDRARDDPVGNRERPRADAVLESRWVVVVKYARSIYRRRDGAHPRLARRGQPRVRSEGERRSLDAPDRCSGGGGGWSRHDSLLVSRAGSADVEASVPM